MSNQGTMTTAEYIKYLENEQEGVRRFCTGERPNVSSSIVDTVTYGYGELDYNGFWEFPVPEYLVNMRWKLAEARSTLQTIKTLIEKELTR